MFFINVVISGIFGRMGSYVYRLLNNRSYTTVIGGIEVMENFANIPICESILDFDEVDLLVDFSKGDNAYKLIKEALLNDIMVLSGTTGISKTGIEELKRISEEREISLFLVPNFAVGASLMYKIIDEFKRYFNNYDLIETHHLKKKDKPSGTAKEYGNVLELDNDAIQSVRINDVIAIHEVIVNNLGEKLTIKHEITHRDAFLKGFLISIDEIYKNEYITVVGLDDFFEVVKKYQ